MCLPGSRPLTPAFEYRVRLPLSHLPADRWEVGWGEPPGSVEVLAERYDVVIGQRLAGHQPDWLRLCADPNVLCVYDADDDLTDLDPENAVPYSIYAPVAEETRRNMAAADVVTVCVPQVLERMTAINPNVRVLPICADPAWFDYPMLTRADRLTIGWGGSPFHHQDWLELPERLAEFARRVPRAEFHTYGADYTRGLLGNRVRVSGLTSLPNYVASLDLDVGLAPLNVALRGSRTRSHTKLLEYGARGIPAVATASGQYVDWIEPGVNGFLVREPGDWVEHLVTLTDDPVRAQMSTDAREKARMYTIDRWVHLWEDAYSGE